MKLNARHIIFGLIGFLVLSGGLWAYRYHSSPEKAVAKYKRELAAAGEKLTLDELLTEAVPPERNGVGLFWRAQSQRKYGRSLLESNSPVCMRMAAPGQALIGWAQPDVRDDHTNSWEEMMEAAAQEEPMAA